MFGVVSLWLLVRRQFVAVRVTAALAVVAIIWGWGAGQYPYMLEPNLTIEQAAAGRATLTAMLVSLAVGALLLVPSMTWLFVIFQRQHNPHARSVDGERADADQLGADPPPPGGAVSRRDADRR